MTGETRARPPFAAKVLDTPFGLVDLLAPLSLSVLLFAGFVKGTPALAALPVDLTLVGAGLVTLVATADVVAAGFVLPAGLAPILLLWLSFLGGIWFMGESSYASDKVLRLVTLTLLSAVGAVTLLRTRRRQVIWLWMVVALGTAVLLVATVAPDQVALESGRLSAEGSNTLATSRAAGAAAAILVVGAGTRLFPRIPAAALAVLSIGAIIATGSRGPLLAVLMAVVVVMALRPGSLLVRGRRVVTSAVLVPALGLAVIIAYGVGTGFARIAGTLTGDGNDESTDTRLYLAQESLRLIAAHPLGIGWGNLPNYLPDSGIGTSTALLEYPHNVLLEVTVEGGWLAGAALAAFIGIAAVRLLRRAADPVDAVLLAVLVFFLVNALVSGDVNDNRMLFAAAGLGWFTGLRADTDDVAPAGRHDDPRTSPFTPGRPSMHAPRASSARASGAQGFRAAPSAVTAGAAGVRDRRGEPAVGGRPRRAT